MQIVKFYAPFEKFAKHRGLNFYYILGTLVVNSQWDHKKAYKMTVSKLDDKILQSIKHRTSSFKRFFKI